MPITPYLRYADVGAALRFFTNALGFRRFGVRLEDRTARSITADIAPGA